MKVMNGYAAFKMVVAMIEGDYMTNTEALRQAWQEECDKASGMMFSPNNKGLLFTEAALIRIGSLIEGLQIAPDGWKPVLDENQRRTWITDIEKAKKKLAERWRCDSGCAEGLEQLRQWLIAAAPAADKEST